MYAFMTTGTTHFLKQLTESHPLIDFYFMKSGNTTLVYYEHHKKKSIFVSGRSFSTLYHYGSMHKTGFVVMDHIPVMEDGGAIFEERFHSIVSVLENTAGLIATRLLKQLKRNHYVIVTQWQLEKNYVDWQRSNQFIDLDFRKMARLSSYFAERPFTNTYFMMKEEK